VLRSLAKQINDARIARDNESIKNSLKDYDEAMEKFMPILMGQCKI
jgi:tetratricopeptide repeat protein 30